MLIDNPKDKAKIKQCLDFLGLPSQVLLKSSIKEQLGTLGVISNILRQINSKTGRSLYRLKAPRPSTMVVGMDVVNSGARSAIGLIAMNRDKVVLSQVKYAPLYKGKKLIKREQDEEISVKRQDVCTAFLVEALTAWMGQEHGSLPA